MRTREALEHFDNDPYKVAAALGISRQAVEQWGSAVPEGSAYKLQVITGGKLKVRPELYRERRQGGTS